MILTFRLPDGASPFMITCGNYLVSSIVLMLVVVASDSFVPLAWPWGVVEWSIAAMAVINAVGYGLFHLPDYLCGGGFAIQVAYLVTVSGVVWGIIIFDEHRLHLGLAFSGVHIDWPDSNQATKVHACDGMISAPVV